MIAKIYSSALKGLSGQLIEIEVAVSRGLRCFNIVGLADQAIEEAKERVNNAIKSLGLAYPSGQSQRITVNLAPATLKKEGSHYDLPLALGILLATQQTNFNPEGKIIIGELSLDGRLKPIKGALSMALMAKNLGYQEIILPKENYNEAALADLLKTDSLFKVAGLATLKECLDYLEGRTSIESTSSASEPLVISNEALDFALIGGQQHAKRGLEIAAAGGHHVFLEGPPGTGKTLLAKAIISILPALEPSEIIELTQIYSLAGLLLPEQVQITQRPFRHPHHSASLSALIGGGPLCRPGEITLGHKGVVFLDEFPEFHRDVLEALRQPLEDGQITVLRAKQTIAYPAHFMLLAAANPCPCGFFRHPSKECTCSPSSVSSYRRKLSGPLLDRFDLFCWVPSVKYDEINQLNTAAETSAEIKKRVITARARQKERLEQLGFLTNAEIPLAALKQFCQPDLTSQQLLRRLVDSGQLSGRGYHRLLKVSRTIADLDNSEQIASNHIAEALTYRRHEN